MVGVPRGINESKFKRENDKKEAINSGDEGDID